MLVTQWLDHDNRETRDADFLGFGDDDVETIKAVFAQIMAITSEDGLDFDTGALTASTIREEMEYGGIRLKNNAYLERTRHPVSTEEQRVGNEWVRTGRTRWATYTKK